MKGQRRNQRERTPFNGPIEINFRDKGGRSIFVVPVTNDAWALNEGDTFSINIRNCVVADLDNGQLVIVIPATTP